MVFAEPDVNQGVSHPPRLFARSVALHPDTLTGASALLDTADEQQAYDGVALHGLRSQPENTKVGVITRRTSHVYLRLPGPLSPRPAGRIPLRPPPEALCFLSSGP